jgi:archaellum component FlaF (FlaF/FlaG flagellin family)
MKLQTVSQTGAGSSSAIVVNTNTNPCNVGIGVLVTGTVNYTVQHTFDNPAVGFTTWFNHPSLAALTANADGNYAFPITAVRITVNSGAGTAQMNFVQAGIA